jgi:hypothetical protein
MTKDTEQEFAFEMEGKTIRQLIQELQTFENQDIEVRMAFDGKDVHRAIRTVGNDLDVTSNTNYCILFD